VQDKARELTFLKDSSGPEDWNGDMITKIVLNLAQGHILQTKTYLLAKA